MRDKKVLMEGLSIIVLVITVVVTVILLAIIVPQGIDKINSAKMATFNHNIIAISGEIQSYMIMNKSEYPAKTDTNGNYMVYSINSKSTLLEQATRKNDENDIFYIVDIDKLNLKNKDVGVGKTTDDYYVVAANSKNVYYAKGIEINEKICHTKIDNMDSVVTVIRTSETTSSSTPTPTPILTPTLIPTSTPTPTPINSPTPTLIPNGAWDGMVNSPKLAAGMIPITWSGNTPVDLTYTERLNLNHEWYDYKNTGTTANRWANVRLKDGSTLVWIPRYTYKIITGEHSNVTGSIDIKLSNGINDDILNSYRIHPAFYWGGWDIPASPSPMTKIGGGTEVTGIWVGKFESNNAGSGIIKIGPNLVSYKSLSAGSIYDKCRGMQTINSSVYGISTSSSDIDTHMLKNSEWGAVAYLSMYALGATDITPNLNASWVTANGDIVANKAQATTGNETGIYDMSAGSWEIMATYINNNDGVLSTNASQLVSAPIQYKDVFPKGATDLGTDNYAAGSLAYGHAAYETSGTTGGAWFGEYVNFPATTTPVFIRGGYNGNTSNSGLFYITAANGGAHGYTSFRVACIVP